MVGLGPEQMAEVPTGSPTRQTGVTAAALPGGERVHGLSLQPQHCLEVSVCMPCLCSRSTAWSSSAGRCLCTPSGSYRPTSCSSSKSEPSPQGEMRGPGTSRSPCREVPGSVLPSFLGSPGQRCMEGRQSEGRAWAAGDGPPGWQWVSVEGTPQ